MKKRLGSVLLAGALSLSLLPMSALAAGTDNFQKRNTYTPGQFTDVTANDWFAGSVQGAYELGLMGGSGSSFAPGQSLTWAQALAMASRLHSIYHTGADNFVQGDPWYQVYADYALNNGIISSTAVDFNGVINRGDFAWIMSKALPAEALPAINAVDDHAIPDVPFDSYIAGPVYTLYRAGILTGNDGAGHFGPDTGITRDAVAAIVTRMADAAQRKAVTLAATPVTLYANDGRTVQVFPDQVAANLAVGWSLEAPVPVTLYANDGRTIAVYPGEVQSYLQVGWSLEAPVPVTLYSRTGQTIQVYQGQVQEYLNTGWMLAPYTAVARDTPLRIYGEPEPEINSADGVSFTISWNSHRAKTIKYARFFVTPYNRVGDKQYCDIRDYAQAECWVAGPIDRITPQTNWSYDDFGSYTVLSDVQDWEHNSDNICRDLVAVKDDGSYYSVWGDMRIQDNMVDDIFINTYWDCIWYNGQIDRLVIDKVVLEYMDGTTETVSGSALAACFY